jgi:hypothetical protein
VFQAEVYAAQFLTLGFLSLSMVAGGRWEEEGREWWKNVAYLASDDLQGRNVGSRGFDLAADYVAEQYERTGLRAAGGEGYFQKISFAEASLMSASLRLMRQGRVIPVAIPGEAVINFNPFTAREVKARLVFAGYGLRIPEAGYDDLKGLPLRGAIVAYLTGGPHEIAGDLRAHYSSNEVRWHALAAAGAVGMIAIPNPNQSETPWVRRTESWASPKMSLADPDMNYLKYLQLSATWNPTFAGELLAGSGHSFEEIVKADANKTELPHFAIGCTLKAKVVVNSHLVGSKNVIAVHPGSDETLKNEYVVVSAHLDHLGIGKPAAHGSSVFHGAMDDASGVASVIEIAKMLKHVSTKRSIVFLAVTGEEKGELGSEYFARYPTVDGRIVADLNMDMFLPLFPLKWLEVQGLNESTLGSDIKAVAEEVGVQVQADKEPDENRFIRSDQYSFVKVGVPALAFKFGYQKGDPEEKIFQKWYSSRYHAVKDDAEQPVDLEAAAQFNDILKALLLRLADAGEAPKWNDDSFFKRFAATTFGM